MSCALILFYRPFEIEAVATAGAKPLEDQRDRVAHTELSERHATDTEA